MTVLFLITYVWAGATTAFSIWLFDAIHQAIHPEKGTPSGVIAVAESQGPCGRLHGDVMQHGRIRW